MAASTYIERTTNRHFASTVYTDEIYSIRGINNQYLLLNQAPVTVLTKLQYRAGLPSTPNWTDYLVDQYDLLENGESGIVRVYGLVASAMLDNTIRATYTAGYKIDWTNEYDITKHNLPADLTMLCEDLVVKWFKRRENAGKNSESINGATIQWDKEMAPEDTAIMLQYTRTPRFY